MLIQKNKIFSPKRSIYSLNLYFYEVIGLFYRKKMADHNVLGWKGEEAAVNYLTSKGHRIVAKNWRFNGYEVDIISEDGEYVVFVEVKTRTSLSWGNPEDFIGKQRMRRMIQAAGIYLKLNCIDKPARFDIVAVISDRQHFELEHIEDAFLPFL